MKREVRTLLVTKKEIHALTVSSAIAGPLGSVERLTLQPLYAAVPLLVGRIQLTTGDTVLGPPAWHGSAWLLSLDDQWFRCDVEAGAKALGVTNAAGKLAGGMSGSPIVSLEGEAIGVLVNDGFPQPILSRNLPAWLLDELLTS